MLILVVDMVLEEILFAYATMLAEDLLQVPKSPHLMKLRLASYLALFDINFDFGLLLNKFLQKRFDAELFCVYLVF